MVCLHALPGMVEAQETTVKLLLLDLTHRQSKEVPHMCSQSLAEQLPKWEAHPPEYRKNNKTVFLFINVLHFVYVFYKVFKY